MWVSIRIRIAEPRQDAARFGLRVSGLELVELLVQVGDQEILLADATRVAARAEEAGVDVRLEVTPDVWHVFQLFAPLLPEANEALGRVGEFVRERLA